mgnify:CR=1 FL=1
MVGKITWYRSTSSIMPDIFGKGRWRTQNEALRQCIEADKGNIPNNPQTMRQRMGDLLEPVLLKYASDLLNLKNLNVDITEKIKHEYLPLEASLDGMAEADQLIVKKSKDNNIFIPDEPIKNKIILDGVGVLECKCSSHDPKENPPDWLGVLQLKSSMNILNAKWGMLVVLYFTDLRIYLYGQDKQFNDQLAIRVLDWERRIDEQDYFPPISPEDARMLYATGEEDTVIELDEKVDNKIDQILKLKDQIKKTQSMVDALNTEVMECMGNHIYAVTKNYDIAWKSRTYKAKPETLVPAKAEYTIRNKYPSFKVRAS